jgi:glucosamine--fructose-6-phosphate aminotransferase (isomerizing)
MCWIFAYSGDNDCREKLVNGLKVLEYRGYDSAGLVSIDNVGKVFLEKAVGRVSQLASKVDSKKSDTWIYSTGIAHTRWATHGWVTFENTHPHASHSERFYVVHNGIIENYKELKWELEKKYSFYSQTDTEVVAKLIESLYDWNLKTTMEQVSKKLVWAYSLAVIDTENPGTIVGIKLWSPLIVGSAQDWVYISSDVNALATLAETYTILEDHEMVVIEDKKYSIYMAGEQIERASETIDEAQKIDELGSFRSYTEKEIFDIPAVLKNAWSGRINFEEKNIGNETLEALWDLDIERICIISSGSSYYAGDMGCYFFRKFAGISSGAIISSEFLADTFIPDNKCLYVFLSQSGETADVRESMKIVKTKGCMTFGIVNVVGSTIARMADMWLYSHAGVEVWVASTKNVIAQVGVLLLMAMSLWSKRDMQITDIRDLIWELSQVPDKISETLMQGPHIKKLAKKYSKYDHMFILWRNYFYPVAGEASLKCKELSYIHCEAYSAWELKHGPLALVSPEFPTIVFNPMGKFYGKTISNVQEVAAREGPILGIISKNDTHKELYTDTIELPETSEILSVFTGLVSSYLFALYLAEALGRDVDKPRNLAKSVTVE